MSWLASVLQALYSDLHHERTSTGCWKELSTGKRYVLSSHGSRRQTEADLMTQIARKVLSDVAYVHTLHGHLHRMIVRAFVMSFRRTFGKLLKLSLPRVSRLTLIFLLHSCSDCSGKYGAGHRDTIQAKKHNSLELKHLTLLFAPIDVD